MVSMAFELTYYDYAVTHINHSVTGLPHPLIYAEINLKMIYFHRKQK